ncbi:MAG: TrmH family RNA methyltransferase [Candidatus Paceibacteria bacterium]
MGREVFLIIHDVRSAHNVGSLFRTADCMGVSKIYLSGYTPAPIDRFGRKDARIAKVALGAEEVLPWDQREITELVAELKTSGVEVAALEQAPSAVPLDAYTPAGDVALIVGNEVDGLPHAVLVTSDATIEIPMKGKKESLNVAHAGAIALYHLAQ